MQSSIKTKLEQLKACVHCGICLPACPTYLTTGNEGHSPRGRLYLIRDYVESCDSTAARHCEEQSNEAIDKSSPLNEDYKQQSINYLDACLECRACESVCPSGVEYANILDYARHEAKLTKTNKGLIALVRKLSFKYLLPNRSLLNLLRSTMSCLITPLRATLNIFASATPTLVTARRAKQSIFSKLKSIVKLSPRLENPYRSIRTNHYYFSNHPQATTLSLPLGCVMDTLYNHVHWDTIRVLNSFGYHVYIPETKCCGALASHSGEYELGRQQSQETLSTLARNQYQVVFNSAGCGAHIKQCNPHYASLRAEGEAIQTYDFIEIIQNAPVTMAEFATQLKNTKTIKATYHPACHLKHAQGIGNEYQELLKLIPNLELVALTEADVCCGSAGFYNLIKPEFADPIGQRKASNIKNANADILVTANPGCISQIQAQLPQQTIMHPISLIASCLNQ